MGLLLQRVEKMADGGGGRRGKEENVRSFPRIADPDVGYGLGGEVAAAVDHVLG